MINLDATRLLYNIKRTPANSASLKMTHFSNIGVMEVFLESTPTTLITTVLLVLALIDEGGDLFNLLIGRGGWSFIIFLVGYAASILSSVFGVSR